jgi:catechol 2,3-dioxygenase-like lactoylglutathione lyase family enzyme
MHWALFEQNDESLWSRLRFQISAFMQQMFLEGEFRGANPDEAYFVKCDSDTMTQADIDDGVVSVVVGFAPLNSAEYVILSIQQLTATSGTSLSYTALQVKDIDASEKFYTSILGMRRLLRKKVKETKGEMSVLKSGRNTLELNWYEDAVFRRGNNLDHLAFEVPDTRAFRAMQRTLRAKKINVHDYLETKGWDRFFIEDPDGNWVEIYFRK